MKKKFFIYFFFALIFLIWNFIWQIKSELFCGQFLLCAKIDRTIFFVHCKAKTATKRLSHHLKFCFISHCQSEIATVKKTRQKTFWETEKQYGEKRSSKVRLSDKERNSSEEKVKLNLWKKKKRISEKNTEVRGKEGDELKYGKSKTELVNEIKRKQLLAEKKEVKRENRIVDSIKFLSSVEKKDWSSHSHNPIFVCFFNLVLCFVRHNCDHKTEPRRLKQRRISRSRKETTGYYIIAERTKENQEKKHFLCSSNLVLFLCLRFVVSIVG